MLVKQVVNVIWQKGRIAAAHGHFSCTRQVASMCTPCNTCFLGLTWVHNPDVISIGSAVFAQLTTVSLYFTIGRPFSPQNCPFPWGDLYHLIHGLLGPPQSSTQTASRSVKPFLQGSLVWPTDHATRSVTIGCIYVPSTVMRPNYDKSQNFVSRVNH